MEKFISIKLSSAMNLIKKPFLRFYSRLNSWDKKQVILIISSGRTGTKFMANWFSKLTNRIYSVHEPGPDLFELGVEKYRDKQKLSKRKLENIRAFQLYEINKQNKNFYVESNPNMILLLPEVNRLFKNLKIIFIKRKFETYFLSAMNKSPDNSNINYFYADNDPRKRITAIDLEDRFYFNRWKDFSREEKIAWWWKTSNKIIDEYHNTMDNSYVINYEDLFSKNNESLLNSLLKFTGLDFVNLSQIDKEAFNNKINTNKIKLIENMNNLDSDLEAKIDCILKQKN